MESLVDMNNPNLAWNIKTHNNIVLDYERIHGEIYNDIEQSRLRNELGEAIRCINTGCDKILALDFGCGAGNLTKHLSSLGCDVLATDVAEGFLDLIKSRSYPTTVKTMKLNGVDLCNIGSNSVDFVASYSVLHHIQDYISIVSEFMRVLKSGGIVYIDHEQSEQFWTDDETYSAFLNEMKKFTPINISKYFRPRNYLDWLIRKFINPRYQREGDIHVYHDDHIEWGKIIETIERLGGDVIISKSYLLFRRGYYHPLYDQYREKTSDMHMLVVKKK
jgi:2-polyprenyl-3-methyl-5-hydroxy-6-metoxy-1,4-benzoquinol methylase